MLFFASRLARTNLRCRVCKQQREEEGSTCFKYYMFYMLEMLVLHKIITKKYLVQRASHTQNPSVSCSWEQSTEAARLADYSAVQPPTLHLPSWTPESRRTLLPELLIYIYIYIYIYMEIDIDI